MESIMEYLCDKIFDDKVILKLKSNQMPYIINFDKEETKIESITVDYYVYKHQALKRIPGVVYTRERVHNSLQFCNYDYEDESTIFLFLDKDLDALEVTISSIDECESFYWIK